MKTKDYFYIFTRTTIFVVLILIFSSCQKEKSLYHIPETKTNNNSNINLSKIKNVSTQDSIVSNGETIYLGNKVFMKGFSDILLVFDKKIIFGLSQNYATIFKIDTSDKDYLLNGQIRDAEFYENCIYLLDSNSDIIVYNLKNGDVDKITINKKIYNTVNFRTAINITVMDENRILLTNVIVPRDNNLTSDKVLLGIIIDLEGKLIKTVSVKGTDTDLESWNLVGDRIFAKRFNNLVLFSFWLSRKTFLYNIYDDSYTLMNLKVDKSWKDPEVKGGIKKMGEGIYAEEIVHLPINLNGLQVSNNQIFQIMNRYNNPPLVIKYDKELNEIERREFNDIDFMSGDITKFYMLHIIHNRVILQSSNELFHYE
ncbi:MAG: hypothetical protein RDU14_17820 [Melioribacteraceae bacterium]|nr:hypothetical protein [Melioribacteraceae bacterium]